MCFWRYWFFKLGFLCIKKCEWTHAIKAFCFPKLYEPPGEHAYMVYCEDVLKTNQGGLYSCKRKSKEVCQYTNEQDSNRCFVHLHKLCNSKCPQNRPVNAFYLPPLGNQREMSETSKRASTHLARKDAKQFCYTWVAGDNGCRQWACLHKYGVCTVYAEEWNLACDNCSLSPHI